MLLRVSNFLGYKNLMHTNDIKMSFRMLVFYITKINSLKWYPNIIEVVFLVIEISMIEWKWKWLLDVIPNTPFGASLKWHAIVILDVVFFMPLNHSISMTFELKSLSDIVHMSSWRPKLSLTVQQDYKIDRNILLYNHTHLN